MFRAIFSVVIAQSNSPNRRTQHRYGGRNQNNGSLGARVGVGRNLLGRGKKELSGMIKMFCLVWDGRNTGVHNFQNSLNWILKIYVLGCI